MNAEQQQVEQARKEYQADPGDANAAYNLAVALFGSIGMELYKGRKKPEHDAVLREAESACRTALALYPGHGSAMIQLGQILYFEGHVQEAESWLDQGLEIDSSSQTWIVAADFKARILMEKERYLDAIPLLEQLVEAHPDYRGGHIKLAACVAVRGFEKLNRGDIAGAEADKILGEQIDPGSAAIRELDNALYTARDQARAEEKQRDDATHNEQQAQAEATYRRQEEARLAEAEAQEKQAREEDAKREAEREARYRERDERRANAQAETERQQAKVAEAVAASQALSAQFQADMAAIMAGPGEMTGKMAKVQALQAEFQKAMEKIQKLA